MSRSRKKTPVGGIATASTEKPWKKEVNRAFRKKAKAAIREGKDLPEKLREISEVWSGPKDGKRFFSFAEEPELMRK